MKLQSRTCGSPVGTVLRGRLPFAFALILWASVLSANSAQTNRVVPVTTAVRVDVPASGNPWLAGMPAGTKEGKSNVAPNQSPVLVNGLSLQGSVLAFRVNGQVSLNGDQKHLKHPDGDKGSMTQHLRRATNGISDMKGPTSSLVGVFLNSSRPDGTPAPETLDFTEQTKRDFERLEPKLKQVFFIGDGLTSGGKVQLVVPPSGASRLYLGTLVNRKWDDNAGAYHVIVSEHRNQVQRETTTAR